MTQCTGVILSGGRNTRMSGKNKAHITLGGKRIIDHVLDVFNCFFRETIIVTNDPLDYLDHDVTIVSDILPVGCSLAGIHAGLFHARTDWIFVSPCDMPFLQPAMVQAIVERITDTCSVVVPETYQGLEPMCAAYATSNTRRIEHNLNRNIYKIRHFFKPGKTRKIPESILRKADPDLRSFFNINSNEDLLTAQNILQATEVV